MDRFIGDRLWQAQNRRLRLKSNMDRFIAKYEVNEKYSFKSLKSNMDRFIVDGICDTKFQV